MINIPKKGFSNVQMSVKALKQIKSQMQLILIRKDRLLVSHLKPTLRMFKNRSTADQKNLETFLKVFVDRKTKLIKIEKILIAMKGLGMKRQVQLVKQFFQTYPVKNKGYITQQQYIKLIQKEQNRDINRLSTQQHQSLFNFFDRYSGQGKINQDKLLQAAQELGIHIDQEQRREMIRYFARNHKALDKYDFIEMLRNPYVSTSRKSPSPKK